MTSFATGNITWLATLSRPLHQQRKNPTLPLSLAGQQAGPGDGADTLSPIVLLPRCTPYLRGCSYRPLPRFSVWTYGQVTCKRSHALVTRHDNNGAQSPVFMTVASASMDGKMMAKTYNRRDSQMVTHSSTSRPVQCLCMAERTGCPVLTDLWSYVLNFASFLNKNLTTNATSQF
jgi:hypothetical protein